MSGTALGKRQRSRVLPRSASMVTVPSAAKQGRQEGVADVPSSSSLPVPAASVGMGGDGGGQAPRGYFSGGYFAGVETAAFLKACGLCNRRLGPGHDTFIYRFETAITDDFAFFSSIRWNAHRNSPLLSRHDSGSHRSFCVAVSGSYLSVFFHVRIAPILLHHVVAPPRSIPFCV